MKAKLLFLMPFFFIILSCNLQDEIIVRDYRDNQFNLLESKREKIIIVTSFMVCHSCIIDLNDFIDSLYNLSDYDYYILAEDMKNIPGRRIIYETYKNDYTPKVNNILFAGEDAFIRKRLNIPGKLFKQPTPYIIHIDKNQKPTYFSSDSIFDSRGSVNSSFRLK